MGLEAVMREALARIGDTPVFLSFDIDFLDAAYAPGTGTPEVEGFTTYEAMSLVRAQHKHRPKNNKHRRQQRLRRMGLWLCCILTRTATPYPATTASHTITAPPSTGR